MIYMCQISFALVFQSVPPILRLIILELNISYAQAGLLMSLFALPGIFVAIPGGMISDRIGIRKVGITSLFLMIVGTLLVGMGGSFILILFGRIVSGIGALTLAVVLPQLLTKWFMHREVGLAMGIFNTGMPLGTILSFNVLGITGLMFGWRTSIFFTTIVTIFALFTFLILFKEPESVPKEKSVSTLWNISRSGASVWLTGLIWMFFNAAFISFLTFAQDFFVVKGYGAASANFLTSIVNFGSLFLSPIIGYSLGKFGKEEGFIAFGAIGLASLLFLISSSQYLIPLLVLIGVVASFVPPPVFSLPSKTVEPQNLGLAFGVLTTLLNVGVLIGPYLVGLARDLTGAYALGFYLMGLFALLQIPVTLMLYFVRRHR
jgi:predicted MFS family arabinose efflux permease